MLQPEDENKTSRSTSHLVHTYLHAVDPFLVSLRRMNRHMDTVHLPCLQSLVMEAIQEAVNKGKQTLLVYFVPKNRAVIELATDDGSIPDDKEEFSVMKYIGSLFGGNLGKVFPPTLLHAHKLRRSLEKLYPGLVDWKSSSLCLWCDSYDAKTMTKSGHGIGFTSFDDVPAEEILWRRFLIRQRVWDLPVVRHLVLTLNVNGSILAELGCPMDGKDHVLAEEYDDIDIVKSMDPNTLRNVFSYSLSDLAIELVVA